MDFQRFPTFVLTIMISSSIVPIILYTLVSIISSRSGSVFLPVASFIIGIFLIRVSEIKYLMNVVLISIALICFQFCFIELFIISLKSRINEGREEALILENECTIIWKFAAIFASEGSIVI